MARQQKMKSCICGSGSVRCPSCSGSGSVYGDYMYMHTCLTCSGSGEVLCPACNGSGNIMYWEDVPERQSFQYDDFASSNYQSWMSGDEASEVSGTSETSETSGVFGSSRTSGAFGASRVSGTSRTSRASGSSYFSRKEEKENYIPLLVILGIISAIIWGPSGVIAYVILLVLYALRNVLKYVALIGAMLVGYWKWGTIGIIIVLIVLVYILECSKK